MDENNEELNDLTICGINDVLGEYELRHIFTYFTIKERMNLRLVSNKWKTFIDNTFKSQKVLNCETIFGSKREEISSKALSLIIKKCFNVKHISLKGMKIFELFSVRVKVFKNFQFRNVSQCREVFDNFNGNVLQTISQNCQHLESIDFWDFYFDEEFVCIDNNFSHLKKIISYNMTERALNSVIDLQNLESLNISQSHTITEIDFQRLGQKITQLNLTLMTNFDINENNIKTICERIGKQITKLWIDLFHRNVLPHICTQMKELNDFKMRLCVSHCDFTQLSKLKHLSRLSIEFMFESHFGNNDFLIIVRSLKNINLKELKISVSIINNSVNYEGIQELSNNCKSLEKLVINNSYLDSEAILPVTNIKALKHLDLRNSENIDDDIIVVINLCPFLTHLVLQNCRFITDIIVNLFIVKANENPNQHFFLNVIHTECENFFREIPSNLKLLLNSEDIEYHFFNDHIIHVDSDDD